MPISRRSLLTAASALPLARAFAQNSSSSANNRVSIGFIGTGARAQELLQATLATPNTEVAGFVDAYKGRIERALERTGGKPKVYHDYQELLANRAIDAVIIATPDHWHRQIAVDAMKAGKDVYCEKPLTFSASEGPVIIQTARETGRMLQVGSQGISTALQQKAREVIQSGRLGQVTMIRAAYNRNTAGGAWIYPIPPDANPSTVNWEMFLGSAPKTPFSLERFFRWRCYWDYSGGIATDLFVHLFTTINFLMDAKMPSKAVALGELYRWKGSRNVPDTLNGVVEYPEGFTVNVSSTLNNESSSEASFQILGTKGTITLGDTLSFTPENVHEGDHWVLESWPSRLEYEYYRDPKVIAQDPNQGREHVIASAEQFRQEGEDATLVHIAHFVDSIRTRKPYWEDATKGHHAAACAHMINKAARDQKLVEWDFTRDDIKA